LGGGGREGGNKRRVREERRGEECEENEEGKAGGGKRSVSKERGMGGSKGDGDEGWGERMGGEGAEETGMKAERWRGKSMGGNPTQLVIHVRRI